MKRKTSKVIVVEGKYDKIRLENAVDGVIVTTEGFGLFNDEKKRAFIRRIAEEKGIIVLCDPDSAGNVIRAHIATITGKKGVVNAYIPPVFGKEKRKKSPSKEGLLGVEGTSDDVIISVLEKAGAFSNTDAEIISVTKADLMKKGFYGTEGASEKRGAFLRENSLPENLSPTAFLDVVNLLGLEIQ